MNLKKKDEKSKRKKNGKGEKNVGKNPKKQFS